MKARERIIVAVDVPTIKDPGVMQTLNELAPHVGYFKIGLELIMADEADIAIRIIGNPSKVMFDAKLHDIPHTVAGAVKRIAAKGVGMFTLHASGGTRMMEAAVANKGDSTPLAVTVLTSHDRDECNQIFAAYPEAQVRHFAMLVIESGIDSIVCSPADIPAICEAEDVMARRLVKITPGIRVDWGVQQKNDQRRIMTPLEAVKAGADYLVIGRDIMQSEQRHGISPLDAVLRIEDEITLGMADL